MRRHGIITAIILLAGVVPALALNPGTDIFVPAGARGSGSEGSVWVTDLYVLNPGNVSVAVDLYWLPRDTDNTAASPVTFTVAGGETLVLPDVILDTFGLSSAGGAFRVVATGSIVVSSRIYNDAGTSTYGQGFEGVPASASLSAGEATDLVGLTDNGSFRTNLFAVNTGGTTATVSFDLVNPSGTVVASKSYEIAPFAALYRAVDDLGAGSFDQGTLHAEVTAGSAIVVASKVDNTSGDPTTLEAWWEGAAADSGTYFMAIYDSQGYATGGSLVVETGNAVLLDATYTNWDKQDAQEQPLCTWTFLASTAFDPPVSLSELADGVSFTKAYPDMGGSIEWTFTLHTGPGSGLTGSVSATGSGFTGEATGCNGTFPPETILGGVRP